MNTTLDTLATATGAEFDVLTARNENESIADYMARIKALANDCESDGSLRWLSHKLVDCLQGLRESAKDGPNEATAEPIVEPVLLDDNGKVKPNRHGKTEQWFTMDHGEIVQLVSDFADYRDENRRQRLRESGKPCHKLSDMGSPDSIVSERLSGSIFQRNSAGDVRKIAELKEKAIFPHSGGIFQDIRIVPDSFEAWSPVHFESTDNANMRTGGGLGVLSDMVPLYAIPASSEPYDIPDAECFWTGASVCSHPSRAGIYVWKSETFSGIKDIRDRDGKSVDAENVNALFEEMDNCFQGKLLTMLESPTCHPNATKAIEYLFDLLRSELALAKANIVEDHERLISICDKEPTREKHTLGKTYENTTYTS